MSLGNRIRSVRKEAGLSQEELARRAGISLNAVRHIEQRGQTDPHYSTLDKLSKVLDMSVDELMGAVAAGKGEAPEEGEAGPTIERDYLTRSASKGQPDEERRLINAVAPAVVAAQKSWEAYLEELPEQPTAKVWKKERKRIKELLTDASEMYEGLEEQGVLEAMGPYVAAIEAGESIPQPFRRNVIGLFNALAAMFVYTIPKANNWASRFEERLQLENIDSVAPEWAAKDPILETGTSSPD